MATDLDSLSRLPVILLTATFAALLVDAASPQQTIDLSGDQQVLTVRPAPARRLDVVRGGGYFPVIAQLRDGSIAAVVRGGGAHVGVAGRLDLVLSRDDGETWSRPATIVDSPWDDRNPAFGVADDGSLVVAYVVFRDYKPDGGLASKRRDGIHVVRSRDSGRTWDEGPLLDLFPSGLVSPFGKMLNLDGGVLMMTFYAGDDFFHVSPPGRAAVQPGMKWYPFAYVIRSRDGGRTWGDMSLIAPGFDEVALLRMRDGRIAAALRSHDRGDTSISFSHDQGRSWSHPKRVASDREHPADLVELADGRLVLIHGERNRPMGIQAMISHDGGSTWEHESKLMLSWLAPNSDCGYPTSLVRRDKRILTLYYQVDDLANTPESASCKAVIWDVPKQW